MNNHSARKLIVLNGGRYTQASLETGLGDWKVERYKAKELVIEILDGKINFYYQNQPISFSNSVLYNRFSRHHKMVGLVYEFFLNANLPVINSIQSSYADATEKIAQMLRSSVAGVPVPNTTILQKEAFFANQQIVSNKLKFPLICKTDGQKGEQVKKIDSTNQLDDYVNGLTDEVFIIQEFIENDYDVRVIIAFGEILGAIKRFPAPESFLNNFSQGGRVEAHSPTSSEVTLAQNACLANHTDVAGVDIIYKSQSPLFLELNIGFGVEGYESIHQNEPVFHKVGQIIDKKFNTK